MARGKWSAANLIAVAVVVVVVVALVYPSVRGPRPWEEQRGCGSNLRQCAQVLKMYCDDFDDTFPSSALINHSKTWNRRDYLEFWTVLCPRGRQCFPSIDRRTTWFEVTYDYMRNKEIMFCIGDPVDRDAAHPTVSYWYKLANDKAWFGVGCDGPRRQTSDYGYESDQIAFYEHSPSHYNANDGLTNGASTHAAFIDTHVEKITIANATSGNPINCAANRDGEPMYYNCHVDPKTGKATASKGPATLTDPSCCYDKLANY